MMSVLILSSCSVKQYYQVYKTEPSDQLMQEEESLFYEDENCIVYYNLWGEGGNIGFRFYNKTSENLYLNLGESFFVLNGIAYNYYKDRVYTNSKNTGKITSNAVSSSRSESGFNYLDLLQTNKVQIEKNASLASSTGFSVAFSEEKIVCIPSNTSKIITEYSINESMYRDCDLFKYPSRKQIKTIQFSKSDSPIVFSNRLAYSIGKSETLVRFENEFYISEITNYPETEIVEKRAEEFCEQISETIKRKYFINFSPDEFYIKYSKGTDKWKH